MTILAADLIALLGAETTTPNGTTVLINAICDELRGADPAQSEGIFTMLTQNIADIAAAMPVTAA